MEIRHCILGIVTVGGRDPFIVHIRVSFPSYKVLNHPASHPRVQHLLHLILLMVIDEVGWRIDMLDWEDGRSVWSEEGFVEDHMSCG